MSCLASQRAVLDRSRVAGLGGRGGADGHADRERVERQARSTDELLQWFLPAAQREAGSRCSEGATRCFPRQRVIRTRRGRCSGSRAALLGDRERRAYGCGSAPESDRLPRHGRESDGVVCGSHPTPGPRRGPSRRDAAGPGAGRSGELLQDQLAHPAGVGLAAHLLHHRTDERTGRGELAVADLVGDVGVGGDRVVDRGDRAPVVGDDRQAAGGDDLLGGALAGEQPSKTWRASLSLRVPASTSAWTAATWAGVTPRSAMSTPLSLARRASSPSHHLRAACGRGARRDGLLDQARARRRRRCRASRGR